MSHQTSQYIAQYKKAQKITLYLDNISSIVYCYRYAPTQWHLHPHNRTDSHKIKLQIYTHARTHTHTRLMALLSETTQVSRYQKDKTNLDFTGARDSEWQWYQLGHMQVCTSLQTNNHDSTPPFSFLQAGCSSCCPTNSVKALKAKKSHK